MWNREKGCSCLSVAVPLPSLSLKTVPLPCGLLRALPFCCGSTAFLLLDSVPYLAALLLLPLLRCPAAWHPALRWQLTRGVLAIAVP